MNKDQIIWCNIERILFKKGWSYAELARQAKTRPQALNSIKNGIRGCGPNLLKRFATALGVDVSELLNTNENNLCPVNCDLEMMQICQKIKYIRDSQTDWWDSLEKNINSFKKGVDIDISTGLTSGTQKPAGRTGSRKKAG